MRILKMTRNPDQAYINVLNKFELKAKDSSYNQWFYQNKWILSYYFITETFALMKQVIVSKYDCQFSSLSLAKHYTPQELNDEISNLLQKLKQEQNNFKKREILQDFEK